METATPNRRRLRVTLRVSMILVLVTGVWMGYIVNKACEQREAVAAIKKYGGWVNYDWEIVNRRPTKGRRPPAPQWLVRLVGQEFFQEVAHVTLIYNGRDEKRLSTGNVKFADRFLSCLTGLTSLKVLRISGSQLTDEGLKHLRGLTEIEQISISNAKEITDVGVRHPDSMKDLKHLDLSQSKVTDSGIASLAKHPKLERISLIDAPVTDAGIAHLLHLENLIVLDVRNTNVTNAGVAPLRRLKKLRVLQVGQVALAREAPSD